MRPATYSVCVTRLFVVLSALSFMFIPGAGAQTTMITQDEAINLALGHNHALLATKTQLPQSEAMEITANLRPNPTLGADTQFIPIFDPSQFTADNLNLTQQFDIGITYLFERGHKRQRRLQAAKDVTEVTRSQVSDSERMLIFTVSQEFIGVLLAESTLRLAEQNLASFKQTVDISEIRYKAGDISEGDYLKIKLQLLQFQTDVSSAQLARVQALINLRQLLGYSSVPADYDVVGNLEYQPVQAKVEDLQATALRERPDLRAAVQGIAAAQSQILLAKANGKQDVSATYDFSHTAGLNSASLFFSMDLPIFNRNQGDIARTRYALTQAQEQKLAAADTVMADVENAYETLRNNDQIIQLYVSGYLKDAQNSRDINEYAYKRGAASLLDYIDAERSYRATELGYRQALASYLTALEQLKQAVGTRNLQ
jgi:cobalt-zinc-cadmium efflux system outer membrane protein